MIQRGWVSFTLAGWVRIRSVLTPDESGFDFWSVAGQHHPVWFQDFRRRSTAGWLQQLLTGQDPDGWFKGWEGNLEKVRDMPFGGREHTRTDIEPLISDGAETK